MRPVRLGLVGFGRWGRVLMRNMSAHPRVVPAALASSQPDAAASVPEGCRVAAHWRDLLTMDLDGLVVATPPATHTEIALAAVKSGLALLVEKPLAMSSAEARALVSAAEQADVLVMVDHIHLFSPAWRRMKDMLPGLGPIRRLHGLAGNHGPYRPDIPVLWDWGPHDVAMILDLMGAIPGRVDAAVQERRAVPGGVGEIVNLILDYPAVRAEARFGTLMDRTRRFTVECRGGTLVYDGIGPVPLSLDGDELPVTGPAPVEALFEAFAGAVGEGSRDRSGLVLGLRTVEVLAAAEARLAAAAGGQLP